MKEVKLYEWQKKIIHDVIDCHWEDIKKIRTLFNSGRNEDLALFLKERDDYIYDKLHNWNYAHAMKGCEKCAKKTKKS